MGNEGPRKEAEMSIPEWQRDAARAVPTSVVKDIVADFGVSPQSRGRSPIVHEPVEPRPNRAVVTPFAAHPPGWEIVSRMMDHQDAQDRADRIIAAAKRRAVLAKEK
jgi:hypothetical protein